MKFQPAQHDLARPGLSEVERAGGDAHLAGQDPGKKGVELPSAAGPLYSRWAIHVATSLSEQIKALRLPVQRVVIARGAGGAPGGRLGLRGPPRPVECPQRATLRLVGKSQVRLDKIAPMSASIVRPQAGTAWIANSIAIRHVHRNVGS
ncbi:hypothetical protein AOQ73_19580 [Bradyrhizobium pachyrhizi]|uniref:hypothetical protein n=1 Tax=Bradyrhizobium pachyrhizi TaxID=280333 RepID=UPI00070497EB|nr:hypothetical protein [Bradyrhizobium pachyrhizi]KRP99733.1 hypothetical protein AOQ73_19580 [Bradyrhizobium pachyrhizi]